MTDVEIYLRLRDVQLALRDDDPLHDALADAMDVVWGRMSAREQMELAV